MLIAILEDDAFFRRMLWNYLQPLGHKLVLFCSAEELQNAVKAGHRFDLMVLDWMLPQSNGIEVMRWLQDHLHPMPPVLFITSRNNEEDTVLALEAGADDYMTKPIRSLELKARIKALSRRGRRPVHNPHVNSIINDYAPYIIHSSVREVHWHDQKVKLTPKELDLLLLLFEVQGSILTREAIQNKVWKDYNVSDATLTSHVSRLRRKLAMDDGSTGWRLHAVYQHGYRLEMV